MTGPNPPYLEPGILEEYQRWLQQGRPEQDATVGLDGFDFHNPLIRRHVDQAANAVGFDDDSTGLDGPGISPERDAWSHDWAAGDSAPDAGEPFPVSPPSGGVGGGNPHLPHGDTGNAIEPVFSGRFGQMFDSPSYQDPGQAGDPLSYLEPGQGAQSSLNSSGDVSASGPSVDPGQIIDSGAYGGSGEASDSGAYGGSGEANDSGVLNSDGQVLSPGPYNDPSQVIDSRPYGDPGDAPPDVDTDYGGYAGPDDDPIHVH